MTLPTYNTPPPADSYTEHYPEHCESHLRGEDEPTEGRRCRDCGAPIR